nr:replicase [Fragaria chiloensis latent virus]
MDSQNLPSITVPSPVSVQDLLSETLKRQCTDETTVIGKLFAEEAKRIVTQSFGSDAAKPLNISFQLSAEQQSLLKRNFPGRVIQFSNSSSSSHSFAAAHRLLETDFVYSCFGNKNATVLDLGGNYVSHLKMKRYNVHCCCPLLDGRDCARHTERLISYSTFKASHPQEIHDVNFCESAFQHCDEKADFAMAIHSTSDLPLDVLCRALLKKGVRKFICTIMIDPDMLVKDRGFIEHFNVSWTIDRYADRIWFDFNDAPCLGYDHKYSTLMQYLTYNAVDLGDSAYRVERKQDFSGVMVIDITRCAGFVPGIPLNCGRSCAWFTKIRNKTIVNISDIRDEVNGVTLIQRGVLIDTKVLIRVCEASFRQFKPNVEARVAVQNICTMLSSATNHCIINGVTMIAGTPLSVDDYVPVATTVYHRVKKIYESVGTVLNNMNTYRDLLAKHRAMTVDDLLNADFSTQAEAGLFSLLRILAFPIRFVAKLTGLLPPGTLTEVVGKTGSVERHTFVRKWGATFLNIARHILMEYQVMTPYLADPELFVPLESVMRAHCDEFGPVLQIPEMLSVRGLKNSIDEKIASDQAEIIAEKLEADKLRAKQEKAILTVAAWIDAHPDGKVPVGLGLSSEDGKFLYPKPTTEVVVEVGDDIVNPHADSIKEAIMYFETMSATSQSTLIELGNHCRWANYGFTTVWAGDENRRIYQPSLNKWTGPMSVRNPTYRGEYERGMTVDGYVTLQWKDGSITEECRRSLFKYEIVIFDDSCIFAAAERMIPSLRKALTIFSDFSVTVMDGVAGCGKSTSIVQNASLDPNCPDLILSSNRSSAEDLSIKIPGTRIVKSRYVRTCDSFLMTNSPPTAKKMFFDECFMQHAGCIYAAATLARCSEVYAYGDKEQIPFISRCDSIRFTHEKLEGKVVQQLVTYRCPVDATAALSKFLYKKKKNIVTRRNVDRSISIVPINAVSQIEIDDKAVYITHTQAEKKALQSADGFSRMKVFSTHEAEGGTFDKVYFVRLSRTSTHLTAGSHPTMGACHGLVALSRHRTVFRYYTTATSDSNDILYKACHYASASSDSELEFARYVPPIGEVIKL